MHYMTRNRFQMVKNDEQNHIRTNLGQKKFFLGAFWNFRNFRYFVASAIICRISQNIAPFLGEKSIFWLKYCSDDDKCGVKNIQRSISGNLQLIRGL